MFGRPLPPFERNPFANGTDPRDTRTLILPEQCWNYLSRDGVGLTAETRHWLVENAPDYCCRVLEHFWMAPELKEMAEDITPKRVIKRDLPFITFESERNAILFKLRWA